MKKIIPALILIFMFFAGQVYGFITPNLPAEIALGKLKEGNYRFTSFKMQHPHVQKTHREKLVRGQHPFAVILACSDSRVVPEIIFDQGLGDLFVIRNSGNTVNENVIGSIQYAVKNFGINLVVVLGHEFCNEIGTAMKENTESPAIGSMKQLINPAIEKCRKENKYSYENVIKTNAILNAQIIAENKELSEYGQKHDLKIIPAYYNISSGEIQFLQ